MLIPSVPCDDCHLPKSAVYNCNNNWFTQITSSLDLFQWWNVSCVVHSRFLPALSSYKSEVKQLVYRMNLFCRLCWIVLHNTKSCFLSSLFQYYIPGTSQNATGMPLSSRHRGIIAPCLRRLNHSSHFWFIQTWHCTDSDRTRSVRALMMNLYFIVLFPSAPHGDYHLPKGAIFIAIYMIICSLTLF